jgi:predicted dehydrogenase
MQQLCFGVVGVGVMGQLYARLLTESPQARLCGVADVVREKAEQVARQYGVPAFANTHELLDTVAVDALVIATDDHQHVGPVCDAAQAGKAILLEKPLATSVADGRAILGQVATSSVRLMVAHCVRFDPRYASARVRMTNGELGQLMHLTARRNAPVAVARRVAGRCSVSMFLGVHDLDFMLWATGQRVRQVYAVGHWGALQDLGVYDSILALLTFEDGTVASLETGWAGPVSSWQFYAAGDKAVLQITTPELGTAFHGSGSTQMANPLYGFDPVTEGLTLNVYQAELAHFTACLDSGRRFLVAPEEALAAVAVAEAIDRSAASGHVQTPTDSRPVSY